jgi:hypothetical protein
MKTWTQLIVLAALLLVFGYVAHRVFRHEPVTGLDCGNPIPCPNNCLKAEDPGWVSMKVDGHPDTDVWMKFTGPNGWRAYNQNHIGHVIALVDGQYIDTGVCPVCQGRTRICP